MKIKPVQFLFIAQIAILAILLAGITACTAESDDDVREAGPPQHPSADSAGRESSMPVVVSAEVVTEFASSQQDINEAWDQFHVDFDSWRNGLTACDRTAAEAALRVFASDFAAITEQARDLPGKGIARDLPDDVISAAAGEEASLRLLRDNWQPGNPTLLEGAQNERAAAATLLRSTQIAIDKLEEMDDPEDREIAKEFSASLEIVEEAWDAYYDSYAELEDEHLDLTLAEIVTRLRVLAEEQELVLESLQEIPSDKVTDPVQDPLIEAAELEEEALGDLLDAFRRAARNGGGGSEEEEDTDGPSMTNGENGAENGANGSEESGAAMSETGTEAPQGSSGNSGNGIVGLGEAPDQFGPNTQGGVTGVPQLPFAMADAAQGDTDSAQDTDGMADAGSEEVDFSTHFDTFEETLDETRPIRRKAGRDLEDLVEDFSEQDREALADFTAAFASLMDDWDDFHSDFDDWVRTEGDCNRASAIAELGKYNQQFNELSGRVRELSQASYLRPSSDLLSEAVDREGAALRSLTSTWAPYESDVYRGLDDERSNAAQLRRLADRRTQEVMERNGIQQ